MKKFIFSIILSVFNVEEYIDEAVNSIFEQDIGFEDNVEIIFVDDGSSDNSGEICEKYKQRYPQNIKVIHKKNGGLSSARNCGVRFATGEYLSFFDPDDILENNALSSVKKFIDEHENEVDVVSIPVIMFGSQSGPHRLNIKFDNGSRVIDLSEEWYYPQMSLATAFVKAETAKKYAFQRDLDIVIAEDAKELIKILSKKRKYGVVANTAYHYRRRVSSQSCSGIYKKNWYNHYLKNFCIDAIEYCIANYGNIPKFAQFMIMYDLQTKIRQQHIPNHILSEEEKNEYYELMTSIVRSIDDDVIIAQQSLSFEHKIWAISKKYSDSNLDKKCVNELFRDSFVDKFKKPQITLSNIKVEKNIKIEIYYDHYHLIENDWEVYIVVNNREINNNNISLINKQYIMNELIAERYAVEFTVPICESLKISFFVRSHNTSVCVTNVFFGLTFPLSSSEKAYCELSDWIMFYENGSLQFKPKKRFDIFRREFLFCVSRSKEYADRKAVLARVIGKFACFFKRKRVCLISDTLDCAGDNGEALFRYIGENKKRDYNVYFVVDKRSCDYDRLKKYGKVVPLYSLKHKIMYITCDYIMFSDVKQQFLYPLSPKSTDTFKDILSQKRMIWLHKGLFTECETAQIKEYRHNVVGIITCSSKQRECILENNLLCSEESLWYTGFPRFDYNANNSQKILAIIPTEREEFNRIINKDSGKEAHEVIKKSVYYNFYTNLLTNQKLLKAASENGYSIWLAPCKKTAKYFNTLRINKVINVVDFNEQRDEIIAKSSILVTDYSITAIDFAYLYKPVIYCRFDESTYGTGKYVEDYACTDNVFGYVEETTEKAVDRIVECMIKGGKLDEVNKKKIDDYFVYNDKNNCQRVYDKITDID